MKTLCGITVVALVLAAPAAAVKKWPDRGIDLLDACRQAQRLRDGERGSDGQSYEAGYCLGMIAGMLHMHAQVRAFNELPRPLFCLPEDTTITVGQARLIVVCYLETHPEWLHRNPDALVVEALHEAFPCAPAASQPQR